jgi:hypothetical protein
MDISDVDIKSIHTNSEIMLNLEGLDLVSQIDSLMANIPSNLYDFAGRFFAN